MITQIFVLDLADEPAFAFEAADTDGAQRIARSDWLLHALDGFCRARRAAKRGRLRLRSATPTEAAIYLDLADEFADTAPQMLIAHLAGV